MKKLVVALSIFAMAFTSCTTNKNANTESVDEFGMEEVKLKPGKKIRTESDSVSYALGVDLSMALKNMEQRIGPDFNINMVMAAINDIYAGKQSLDSRQAMMFLQEYFSVRIPAKKEAEEQEFLANAEKTVPNIQKTESGLMYDIILPGSDVKPTDIRDRVRVMYKGTLKDGTVFDSSYDRGDTAEFALNHVIKGWGEGMQLVGEGGKIKLWIPSELGYGKGGGPIGASEPLVFEVELFEVIPYVEEDKK